LLTFFTKQSIKKQIEQNAPIWIGHLIFLLLGLLSLIWYKERTTTMDSAFYIFQIIQAQDFDIVNGRWGSAPTQVLPLIAVKLGYTLKTILKLYSVNLWLYQYAFFIVITHIVHQRWVGLMHALSLILFYRFSFYYAASEVHFAFAPTFLFFALISKIKKENELNLNRLLFVLATLCVIYISYTHLLFLIIALFLAGYVFISDSSARKSTYFYITFFLSVVWIIFKILSVKKGSYDAGKMPEITAFIETFKNLKSAQSYQFIKNFGYDHYKLPALIFLISCVAGFYYKKVFSTMATIAFLMAFSFLIIVTYRMGEGLVVQENYWILCGIPLGVLFTDNFLKQINAKLFTLISVLIVGYSIFCINKSRLLYHQKFDLINRIASNARNIGRNKLIVNRENISNQLFVTDWVTAVESIVYTSIENPDSAIALYVTPDINQFDAALGDNPDKLLTVSFAPLWYDQHSLPKKYFNIKKQTYFKMNSVIDKNLDSLFLSKKIYIKSGFIFQTKKQPKQVYPLSIQNNNLFKIPSINQNENSIFIETNIYNEKGDRILSIPISSALETDLMPNSTNQSSVFIGIKLSKGKYTLKSKWKVNNTLLSVPEVENILIVK